MINDIYAGEYDSSMFDFIAKNNIPYVLMHMKKTPLNMQKNITYEDFEKEIIDFFKKKSSKLKKLGHKQLIIDPGFGFGKTVEQNFKMINLIPKFKRINKNILVGISRKSMIYKTLKTSPEKSLNTICTIQGANILRVHDVKEAKEILKMINLVKKNN